MKVGVPITILGQMKHHHNTEKLIGGVQNWCALTVLARFVMQIMSYATYWFKFYTLIATPGRKIKKPIF